MIIYYTAKKNWNKRLLLNPIKPIPFVVNKLRFVYSYALSYSITHIYKQINKEIGGRYRSRQRKEKGEEHEKS